MPTIFTVRAKGPAALFCSPWLRAEPHTEPVMTPAAAAGLLRSLYRKPEFEWVIHAIHILAPIRYETYRRKAILGDYITSGYGQVSSRKVGALRQPDQTLQTQTCLRDVDYLIHAEVHRNPTELRSQHTVECIVESYLRKGSVFGTPCGGRAEFPLDVEFLGMYRSDRTPCTSPPNLTPISASLDLGPTLLGMAPVDAAENRWDPVFVRLRVVDGVVNVPRPAYGPLLKALGHAAALRKQIIRGAA